MSTIYDTPGIYIADLAAYNAGKLVGDWIDIDEDTTADEVWEHIREVLLPGNEEVAIHDYQNFGNYQVGEYEGIEQVVKIGNAIAEHGPALAAYISQVGDFDSALASFEEAFEGEHESEKDFAYTLADAMGIAEDDSIASRYFDWDAWTRDLFLSDYTSVEAPGYKVWVFNDNV